MADRGCGDFDTDQSFNRCILDSRTEAELLFVEGGKSCEEIAETEIAIGRSLLAQDLAHCQAGALKQLEVLGHGVKRRLELLQEFVSEFFDNDETLRRAAGLSRVVHLSPNGPLDRMFEVGIFEHDKCVTPSELHRGHLEVLPGSRRDAPAGVDAAG